MSAGAIGAGATAGADFYDHDQFDDRRFFARGRGAVDESERLTVSEERLDVGKRQVSAGEVGVRKNVETRHVEEEVELMREEVNVERRPISADAGNSGDIRINDGEIRIPVMREEAVVEKRLVPTELGTLVNGLLVEHFPNVVDAGFTSTMEEDLDEIASGVELAALR